MRPARLRPLRSNRRTRMFFTLFRSRSRSSAPARAPRRAFLSCEALETRLVPSADLRIATYNIGAGVRSGMDTVLRAIGDQVVNGESRPVDVLALQEVDLNLTYASSVAS